MLYPGISADLSGSIQCLVAGYLQVHFRSMRTRPVPWTVCIMHWRSRLLYHCVWDFDISYCCCTSLCGRFPYISHTADTVISWISGYASSDQWGIGTHYLEWFKMPVVDNQSSQSMRHLKSCTHYLSDIPSLILKIRMFAHFHLRSTSNRISWYRSTFQVG